ncbi:MAG TPA: hypothetical protein VIM12_11660 [Noviherbaspirillum sp.]|jgi:NSS family neurotransmitter:Na+ symporter|uniref:hypothetical protein n=1 Tax=Noviherbaspirillum sp. TaxID=1926288 RepID=UPI002F95E938
MLSLMEVPVLILHERFSPPRTIAVMLTLALLALSGSLCALSGSLLADRRLFGLNMFDVFDVVSSNILLPGGGILLAFFVGRVCGFEKLRQALSNNGQLENEGLSRLVFFLLRHVTPLLILVVMVEGLAFL